MAHGSASRGPAPLAGDHGRSESLRSIDVERLSKETSAILTDIFRVIDSGGDGHVTMNDIMRLERALGTTKITKNEAEKGLRALDVDGNDTVELIEFLEAMAPRIHESGLPERVLNEQLRRMLRSAREEAASRAEVDDDEETLNSTSGGTSEANPPGLAPTPAMLVSPTLHRPPAHADTESAADSAVSEDADDNKH